MSVHQTWPGKGSENVEDRSTASETFVAATEKNCADLKKPKHRTFSK